jgi:hypothetical protein
MKDETFLRLTAATTLVGLLDAVDDLDHDNWWICGPGARNIAGSRREYYRLPTVARELARVAKTEGR